MTLPQRLSRNARDIQIGTLLGSIAVFPLYGSCYLLGLLGRCTIAILRWFWAAIQTGLHDGYGVKT